MTGGAGEAGQAGSGQAGGAGGQGGVGGTGGNPSGTGGTGGPGGVGGVGGGATDRERDGYPAARVRLWLGLFFSAVLIFTIGILTVRAIGETSRIADANAVQDRQIQANLDRIERDVRADCLFKLDIMGLPELNREMGTKPSPALVRLAGSARIAFVGKHCEIATNPRTGKPFGPPPPVG